MDTYIYKHNILELAIHWDGSRATRIELNSDSRESEGELPEPVKAFFQELDMFFAGRAITFSLPLDTGKLSSFARKVMDELANVYAGETISYDELARLAGKPGAARAVGSVMRNNPFPIIIPCHRVIGSDGSLTGYVAGLEVKRYLLELEKKPGK